MNSLIPFNYNSNQIRIIVKDGEPWFVAADVCSILDIDTSTAVNGRNRISDNGIIRDGGLDDDEKDTDIVSTPGGSQEVLIVSEAGLYSLILKSRKPEAKAFKRWITHEVIPSIRKHGAYMTPETIEKVLLNPDTIIQLATALKEERQRRLMLEPKAMAFDTFMDGSNLQTMNDVAKCLGNGRNKLFKFLREEKIMRANNTPYQEYIDRGYFEVKEKPIQMGDSVINYAQTFVTAKGVDYIRKLLDKCKSA
jgi:anti-repressor protein